ncbi:MAG: ATP-binding cassette domain-containing protein [Gammaproteobacteria bacterium]|jgi:phospholipid/cholesterol/gamma-HCH transport system ATP-binding protein|nr:ATP-binding cassette domain-containing protein [Gammaproteobacteria bacterium]MBT4606797.1 ATP-binding cassette domain-containing protein [Thiotrichales bacterium]MBT3471486.1 ATP-binding cassette domain-containing protein [Gammaproteobacteria bacterium]MBT6079500.1 ATP-binding cassette domain-containing protein [Gammaproteobacteria bacterium]MBT7023493.1 ATP-binding cassette domain-containing protein [Gammaproteobacteria bacterium]
MVHAQRKPRKRPRRKPADVLVRIRGLEFAHQGREVEQGPIFRGVDLDFYRGKVVAILGPSGTGKTTLLKLIGGQLSPQAGTIEVDGEVVDELDRKGLYRLRKRMGMLFQSGALLTDMTVFDNVAFPIREHSDLPESMVRDLVLMKLEAVGLRGAQELMPAELSGGMARRVALARAIALDPMMILYDEPFTGQDPISMGVLIKLIRELNQTLRLTSVVVSHDVEETLSIADYVYLLSEGQVVGQGTPQQIRKSSSAWVQQFLRGEPDGPVPFHIPTISLQQELLEEGA